MRRFLLLFSVFFLAAGLGFSSQYFHYAGYHVSPHGLMLSNWEISGPAEGPAGYQSHPKDKPIQARFTLTNVTDRPLVLEEVYVAGRFYGQAEKNQAVRNFDFAKLNNVHLDPGQSKKAEGSLALSLLGNWRFWPAYKVNGEDGPLRWHDKVIRVESKGNAAQGGSGGTQVYPGPDVTNGLRLTNFKVAAPSSPKLGNTVVVDFDLANVSKKPMVLAPNGVFVGGRANLPTVIKDFGFKGVTLQPGQGTHVHASRKLDEKGRWFFWPGYKISGGSTGPFRWHSLDVVVN